MTVWVQVPLAVLHKKIDPIHRDCLTNSDNLFVLVQPSATKQRNKLSTLIGPNGIHIL